MTFPVVVECGFLIQDDKPTRPHKHKLVQHLIDGFVGELFPHPDYSPGTAPSDFHTFPGLKDDLAGKRFPNEES